MLTRLKVKGFKNLVDVDLKFGPFTIIAGTNGVGKSNLFDAIQLLSALADKSLLDAVTSVRQETSSSNATRVFTQNPGVATGYMSFEVEMLVGGKVVDDLEQESRPSARHLKYALELKFTKQESSLLPKIEICSESLGYLNRDDSTKALPFARRKKIWLKSVQGGKRTSPLISTRPSDDGNIIKVHEDSGHQGRPRELKASTLTRTILSTINTIENPTALAARREMQSWRLIQLEPSRLRAPSGWGDRPELGLDGAGLPAVLNRLFLGDNSSEVESKIVNRLYDLIGDIRNIRIDSDERRESYTVVVGFKDGSEYRARDLSDGTLRILALATLESDPKWGGLLCMEEPENGIHPSRIPSIMNLLRSISVDLYQSVDEDNPLRQVIINTHSPEVVGLSPNDALLLAIAGWVEIHGRCLPNIEFRPLSGTWRDAENMTYVTRHAIGEYLRALDIAIADVGTLGSENEQIVAQSLGTPLLFLEGI